MKSEFNSSEEIFITCEYQVVDLKHDYYAVAYIGDENDVKDFIHTEKEMDMAEAKESYALDEYKPPARDSIKFGKILLVGTAMLTAILSALLF